MSLTVSHSESMLPPFPEADWPATTAETAFLFDLDGTLVEIAPLPDDIVAPAGLEEALAALVRLTGGAVGIVSGRRIARLERLLPSFDGPLAGVHGLEIRLGGSGSAVATEPGGGDGLELMRAALASWIHEHPGLTIEDKGLAIAIHFRARPDQAEAVDAFAEAVLARAPDLRIQRGKMVVEVRAKGPGKGDAVAAMMALPAFAGRKPLFFGDDVTDEDGFAEAAARGGAGIYVGDLARPTLASFQLPDPSAVLSLIREIVDQPHGAMQGRKAWG